MKLSHKQTFDESDYVSDMSENKSYCATDNRRYEYLLDAILRTLQLIMGELGVIIGFLFTSFLLRS